MLVLAALCAADAAAQTANFDDRPTGFLGQAAGGMPRDAWSGTSLGTAKREVSALAAAPRSRSLRDLQFKVMVSDLVPPAADGSGPPSLFSRRVDRLAAMGEGESLNEVVRSANAYSDPAIATTVVNAMMMAGERAGACNIVSNHPLTGPFARRAEVACKLMVGDSGGALALAAPLRGSDAGFAALVQVAANGLPPIAAPGGPLDGPTMIMLDMAHVSPPAAALQSTQPPVIRGVISQRNLPMATRIDVAERGEALAVIEATRLSDLYVEAVRTGASLPAPMARRARLVAAARNASNPQEIIRSIAAVYADTRGSPLFPTIARATASVLLTLPPKPEYADIAQEAMRGLLLLGANKHALAWTKLALNAAYNNARAIIAIDRMMPLVIIAGVDTPRQLAPEDVNRWYEVLQQDDPQRAPLRGYLLLQLFRATGYDMAPRSTTLPEAPPPGARLLLPPVATLQALQTAASGRRRAESALLGAAAIGEMALAEIHPAAVGSIVRALREAGEDRAARLFAIETAIAHGL